MGVSGCGKSTLASALASELHLPYVDADGYHCPLSREKMARGEPLTDEDRRDWLLGLRRILDAADATQQPIVLACSALKEAYRQVLGIDPVLRPLVFIRITAEHALRRVAARADHFMPPALVESQFAALEPPRTAIEVSAKWSLDHAVRYVMTALTEAVAKEGGDDQ